MHSVTLHFGLLVNIYDYNARFLISFNDQTYKNNYFSVSVKNKRHISKTDRNMEWDEFETNFSWKVTNSQSKFDDYNTTSHKKIKLCHMFPLLLLLLFVFSVNGIAITLCSVYLVFG